MCPDGRVFPPLRTLQERGELGASRGSECRPATKRNRHSAGIATPTNLPRASVPASTAAGRGGLSDGARGGASGTSATRDVSNLRKISYLRRKRKPLSPRASLSDLKAATPRKPPPPMRVARLHLEPPRSRTARSRQQLRIECRLLGGGARRHDRLRLTVCGVRRSSPMPDRKWIYKAATPRPLPSMRTAPPAWGLAERSRAPRNRAASNLRPLPAAAHCVGTVDCVDGEPGVFQDGFRGSGCRKH